MKKYAVYPGRVLSQFDGQMHFIGAEKLINLYNVNPEECVICQSGQKPYGYKRLVSLFPLATGCYPNKNKENSL